MILVLGEWRDGKVRPVPGNAPHDRPVSRGFVSSKSICDDSLRTTRFPQLPRTRRGPRRAFFKAWQNLSVRCGAKTKPEPGPTASRRSAPAQIEERVGRTTFFSSSTMSSAGYSLIGLVATRAHLRFTGTRKITCASEKLRRKATFLLCQEHDISILP